MERNSRHGDLRRLQAEIRKAYIKGDYKSFVTHHDKARSFVMLPFQKGAMLDRQPLSELAPDIEVLVTESAARPAKFGVQGHRGRRLIAELLDSSALKCEVGDASATRLISQILDPRGNVSVTSVSPGGGGNGGTRPPRPKRPLRFQFERSFR
jgi:hypothetical protein